MIDVYYVTSNMMSKYVLAGLEVAQDIGGVTVTAQPLGAFSEEKAIISVRGRNIHIVDIEYISVEEHSTRLYKAITGLKDKL